MGALQGVNALVIGGAGTIGSTIVDQLLDSGAGHVDVLDNQAYGRQENLRYALASGRVGITEADLRDRDCVNDLTRGKDLVFYEKEALVPAFDVETKSELDVLVDGTFTVFEAAAAHRVSKLVSASSVAHHAKIRTCIPEDPCEDNKDALYALAKSFDVGMARRFKSSCGLSTVFLRYGDIYGPRMTQQGAQADVLIQWMERITHGRHPLIFGDPGRTIDILYTADVAQASLRAATCSVTEGDFSISSGTETTLLQLAEALLEAMGSLLSVEYRPDSPTNATFRSLTSSPLTQQDLAFSPTTTIEEGLRTLARWWSSTAEERLLIRTASMV